MQINLLNPFAQVPLSVKELVKEPLMVANALTAVHNRRGIYRESDDPPQQNYGSNAIASDYYQVPMTLRDVYGHELKLPSDPLVSVSSKYNITKRNVQKQGSMRGTVKEYWNQGDYTVQIAGVIIADSKEQLESYMITLREICDSAAAISVECEMLNKTFDIMKIVVESLDFPFTKGICNQTFTIKALSDESHNLFV